MRRNPTPSASSRNSTRSSNRGSTTTSAHQEPPECSRELGTLEFSAHFIICTCTIDRWWVSLNVAYPPETAIAKASGREPPHSTRSGPSSSGSSETAHWPQPTNRKTQPSELILPPSRAPVTFFLRTFVDRVNGRSVPVAGVARSNTVRTGPECCYDALARSRGRDHVLGACSERGRAAGRWRAPLRWDMGSDGCLLGLARRVGLLQGIPGDGERRSPAWSVPKSRISRTRSP